MYGRRAMTYCFFHIMIITFSWYAIHSLSNGLNFLWVLRTSLRTKIIWAGLTLCESHYKTKLDHQYKFRVIVILGNIRFESLGIESWWRRQRLVMGMVFGAWHEKEEVETKRTMCDCFPSGWWQCVVLAMWWQSWCLPILHIGEEKMKKVGKFPKVDKDFFEYMRLTYLYSFASVLAYTNFRKL